MTTEEQGIPEVALGSGCETDVYCEVAYNYKETSFEVSWRLKNPGVQDWPMNLTIAPVVCSPSVRSFTETNICTLRGETESTLKLKVDLPDNL